ncbi:unnamed protein product, partial [Meganyctiphanes norvegica]
MHKTAPQSLVGRSISLNEIPMEAKCHDHMHKTAPQSLVGRSTSLNEIPTETECHDHMHKTALQCPAGRSISLNIIPMETECDKHRHDTAPQSQVGRIKALVEMASATEILGSLKKSSQRTGTRKTSFHNETSEIECHDPKNKSASRISIVRKASAHKITSGTGLHDHIKDNKPQNIIKMKSSMDKIKPAKDCHDIKIEIEPQNTIKMKSSIYKITPAKDCHDIKESIELQNEIQMKSSIDRITSTKDCKNPKIDTELQVIIGRNKEIDKMISITNCHDSIKEAPLFGPFIPENTAMPYRRKTWPICLQISEQASLQQIMPHKVIADGNTDKLSSRIKIFFIKMKDSVKEFLEKRRDQIKMSLLEVKKYIEPLIQKRKEQLKQFILQVKQTVAPIVPLIPVIMSVVALILTLSDVGTDAAFAYRVCTTPCGCQYAKGACRTPRDICGDATIHGISVNDYCWGGFLNRTDEATCKKKEDWEIPATCRCSWDDEDGTCDAILGGRCQIMGADGTDGWDYCRNNRSKSDCQDLPEWPHPDYNNVQIRHPHWCASSIGFILGPSMIINMVLLVSLLYKLSYKRYFLSAGYSSIANVDVLIVSLSLTSMAVLQMLPYM